MSKRTLLALLVLALSAASVFAEALGVKELVSAGRENNLDIQKARRTLQDAKEALPWKSELPSTQAKLSGGYDSSGRLSAQAQVSVPIIPQVSVSANVSITGSAGASVSVSPFAASRTRYKEEASYETAEAQLGYQTAKLGYDIESAVYDLLQARANVNITKARLDLQTQKAEIASQLYAMGELTFTDFQSAQSALISARQSAFDAERSVLNARSQLYRLLGPESGEPDVKEVSVDELTALIAARDAEIAGKDPAAATSLTIRQAEINLESLRAELKVTPAYRPSLGLSGQLSYNPDSPGTKVSASGSVSFSFSPSDIKSEDRQSVVDSLSVAERQLELERTAQRLQYSVLLQALEVSRQVLESAKGELKQAEATLESATLLLAQGQRTTVEVEDARISVESAKQRLFQASTGVLEAQAQILLSYVV